MELIRDNVKIEFEDIGEGLSGDYNANDPNDVALLRFYVFAFAGDEALLAQSTTDPTLAGLLAMDALGWTEVEGASYCTNVPVDTPEDVQRGLLELLMDAFYEAVRSGESVKKIGERMSWIDPSWKRIDYHDAEVPEVPMTCSDCGRPTLYDYRDEAYHHAVDAQKGCFLIPAEDRPDDPNHPLRFLAGEIPEVGDVDTEAAALGRKVAEALEAGTGHLLGETERLIIYRVLRTANAARVDTGYCAWCEEAGSPTYLAHEGHDKECPQS
jgi:hypothetical protein